MAGMMSVSSMAVLSGLCTSGNAAGIVGMAAYIRTPGNAAGMIPVPVVSGVGITVRTVVHMGSCLGTACDTAYVVAVFPGQRTAADAAKTVLVFFRLCTSPNGAGNVCLIFLGCVPGFRGSFIYRIGDDTACYHGNRYKCYGR